MQLRKPKAANGKQNTRTNADPKVYYQWPATRAQPPRAWSRVLLRPRRAQLGAVLAAEQQPREAHRRLRAAPLLLLVLQDAKADGRLCVQKARLLTSTDAPKSTPSTPSHPPYAPYTSVSGYLRVAMR